MDAFQYSILKCIQNPKSYQNYSNKALIEVDADLASDVNWLLNRKVTPAGDLPGCWGNFNFIFGMILFKMDPGRYKKVCEKGRQMTRRWMGRGRGVWICGAIQHRGYMLDAWVYQVIIVRDRGCFPKCIAREKIWCDVDENNWPNEV